MKNQRHVQEQRVIDVKIATEKITEQLEENIVVKHVTAERKTKHYTKKF